MCLTDSWNNLSSRRCAGSWELASSDPNVWLSARRACSLLLMACIVLRVAVNAVQHKTVNLLKTLGTFFFLELHCEVLNSVQCHAGMSKSWICLGFAFPSEIHNPAPSWWLVGSMARSAEYNLSPRGRGAGDSMRCNMFVTFCSSGSEPSLCSSVFCFPSVHCSLQWHQALPEAPKIQESGLVANTGTSLRELSADLEPP